MSLPVSRLIRVSINLSPLAAAQRSFGILMIAGDSNVINGLERFRTYSDISGVAADFGTSAPEYLAAALYFGQSPSPATCMIGRWLRIATAGLNMGGILTPTQQLMSNWTVITSGALTISIDGVSKVLTGLDFSGQTNLNGVATVITTALAGSAVVAWTGSYFTVTSSTTGTTSSVSAAVTASLATQMKLTSTTLQELVPGYAAEQPVDCATVLANMSSAWYGLTFAASVQPTDDQSIAVCDFIEALDLKRMFGVSSQDTAILSAASSNDIASLMMANNYLQSLCQYSSSSPYAVASLFGRAFSVNFNGNNTTIALMYKQEPLITGEVLTTTQADTVEAKRCNVFVDYVNNTMIIQYGTMSGSAYIDEIHGLDWFQDAVQNAVYNLLYTSTTKIPQTDGGVNQLVNAIGGACDQAVANGLAAPGTWTGPSFGTLQTGQYLKLGYYIYSQPLAQQSAGDRAARKAPAIQVALKLAGAIQEADIIIQVNR